MLKVSVITAPSLVVIGSSVFFGGLFSKLQELIAKK